MTERALPVVAMAVPEILQVPIDGRRAEYDQLAGAHKTAAEGIVRLLCRSAQRVRPVKERQGYHEVTLWCLDNNISDGAIDTATRVQAVVSPARPGAQTESGAVVPEAYRRFTTRNPFKKDDPEWAPGMQAWSRQGIYVHEVALWKNIPLQRMESHENALTEMGHALFTHTYYDLAGNLVEDGYKALHTRVEPEHIEPLPAYEEVVEGAYRKFAVTVMRAVLDKPAKPGEPSRMQTLAAALAADAVDTAPPPTNLRAYKEETSGQSISSRRIAHLALVLRRSVPNVLELPLTSHLLDGQAHTTASAGLLRKDMYEGGFLAEGLTGYATHGLQWIQENAAQARSLYYERIGDFVDVFKDLLHTQIAEVAARTATAKGAARHLDYDVRPVPKEWREVAIT